MMMPVTIVGQPMASSQNSAQTSRQADRQGQASKTVSVRETDHLICSNPPSHGADTMDEARLG